MWRLESLVDLRQSQRMNEALTAWATAGAVVVALFFGVRAETRAAATGRRAQAALVSAWLEVEPVLGGALWVVVRNASTALIYNVRVHHRQPDRVQSPLFVEVVRPNDSRRIDAADLVGDPWTVPFDLESTDAAGVTWLRTQNGRVTRTDRLPG